MTGPNSQEIRVAGRGRVLTASLGIAEPTTVEGEWPTGWKDLGYTTTDGVKLAHKDKIDPIDTWQSISAARLVHSDRDVTFKFQLLQINEDTLPFFHGGGEVKSDGAISGIYTYAMASNPRLEERMLGVEFTDGSDVVYRLVVARGQVTETTELSLVRNAPVKLGVTFTALAAGPDTPLVTFIMKDPSFAVA